MEIILPVPGKGKECGTCKLQKKDTFLLFPFVVFPCKEQQKEGDKGVNFDKEIGLYRCDSYSPKVPIVQSIKNRLIPFKNRLLHAAYSLVPSMPPF